MPYPQEKTIIKPPGMMAALIIVLAVAILLPSARAYDSKDDQEEEFLDVRESAKEWLNLSWAIADSANAKSNPDEDDLKRDELNLSFICVNKSLLMDRNLSSAWGQKGDLLKQRGRYDEAVACYDRLLSEDPLNHKVWLKKGQAFDGLNRWSEAINCYNIAILCCQLPISAGVFNNITKQEEGIAWYNKACSNFQMKNYDKALLCYNRSIEIFCDPNASEDINDLANAWMGKGNSLRALGNYEESMHCYDEIISNLSVSPYNPCVVHALSAKGLSELLLAKKLRGKDDRNASLHCNFSTTYFAKAIETLENDENLTNDKDAWSDYFGQWIALSNLPGREIDASEAFDKSISLTGGTVMPSWASMISHFHGLFTRAKEILRDVSGKG